MYRVQANGRQQRGHFAQKIIAQPVALLAGPFLFRKKPHALFSQSGQHFRIEQIVLVGYQCVGLLDHGLEGVGRGGFARSGDVTQSDALFQLGDANLKKFVKIGRDDAQETKPFQQRRATVLRLGQHAPVERDIAKLQRQQVRQISLDRHGGCYWQNGNDTCQVV